MAERGQRLVSRSVSIRLVNQTRAFRSPSTSLTHLKPNTVRRSHWSKCESEITRTIIHSWHEDLIAVLAHDLLL